MARQTDSVVAAASSRLYKRHQRYARQDRLNHSKQELEWLNVQATRLSTTAAVVFAALDSYTADQIEAMSVLA
jgi:hypothetical protein